MSSKCKRCTKLVDNGNGLYFCPYRGTYYEEDELATLVVGRCRGYVRNVNYLEEDWIALNLKRSEYSKKRNKDALTFTICQGCGKKVKIPLSTCYCDDCREREVANDNRKVDEALDDPGIMLALCREIMSAAVQDYRLTLRKIMSKPLDALRYKDKYELEDYFHSVEFRRVLEYTLDLEGKLTDEDFKEKSETLIKHLKKREGYAESKYPPPDRRVFGL